MLTLQSSTSLQGMMVHPDVWGRQTAPARPKHPGECPAPPHGEPLRNRWPSASRESCIAWIHTNKRPDRGCQDDATHRRLWKKDVSQHQSSQNLPMALFLRRNEIRSRRPQCFPSVEPAAPYAHDNPRRMGGRTAVSHYRVLEQFQSRYRAFRLR